MERLGIKPLSINQAYQGRKFSTPELKTYKMIVHAMLPKIMKPEGKLALFLRFGMSSKQSDVDNCVKCFQDCLAEKYGFNDKMIYKLSVEKVDCASGAEFIDFEIQKYVQ